MIVRADAGFGLAMLSDSQFVFEDRTQDIRALSFYDQSGEPDFERFEPQCGPPSTFSEAFIALSASETNPNR